ncbi:rhodanese-like domain-containing protein [Granulicella sp. dw_53]|uniref:rhodanese-like domain-containing protein n=1 Tax=Granulicella sp. dw_53 TaxID=2719792 RepID=UPI001BD47741|nr:rhodanese-like domain-containing protein [Granulicella sp. dw_53]
MGLIELVAHHGYLVTVIVVFLAAVGIPLPVSIALLAGGAASHQGLRMEVLLPLVWGASLVGDTLLYLGGRYTGWWLLAGMCRLSMNPEQCIFGSAGYFYRRGPGTLVFAKFVPGLGTMAAPLAGSLNMRFGRFLRMAALGDLLYCSVWLGVGWVFSGFLREIAWAMESAQNYLLKAVVVLVAGYGIALLVFTLRARRYRLIERITAASLHERLQVADPERLMIIADVRSHGYYDPGMQRIKNSIRVEPHRLKEELAALREFMAPECEIYLYCSCIRDTTSVRVAHMLQQENCQTRVIKGGMKAWVKAGGAVELVPAGDVQHLPRFD